MKGAPPTQRRFTVPHLTEQLNMDGGVHRRPHPRASSRRRVCTHRASTGARTEAWCLLIHAEASLPFTHCARDVVAARIGWIVEDVHALFLKFTVSVGPLGMADGVLVNAHRVSALGLDERQFDFSTKVIVYVAAACDN